MPLVYRRTDTLCYFCNGTRCPHTPERPCTVTGMRSGIRCWCNGPDREPSEKRALSCPDCDAPHVDEGEWATRPHKTHLCGTCGHEWRPAEHYTVGIQTVAEESL